MKLLIREVHQDTGLDELTAYPVHDLIGAICNSVSDKSSGKRHRGYQHLR